MGGRLPLLPACTAGLVAGVAATVGTTGVKVGSAVGGMASAVAGSSWPPAAGVGAVAAVPCPSLLLPLLLRGGGLGTSSAGGVGKGVAVVVQLAKSHASTPQMSKEDGLDVNIRQIVFSGVGIVKQLALQ